MKDPKKVVSHLESKSETTKNGCKCFHLFFSWRGYVVLILKEFVPGVCMTHTRGPDKSEKENQIQNLRQQTQALGQWPNSLVDKNTFHLRKSKPQKILTQQRKFVSPLRTIFDFCRKCSTDTLRAWFTLLISYERWFYKRGEARRPKRRRAFPITWGSGHLIVPCGSLTLLMEAYFFIRTQSNGRWIILTERGLVQIKLYRI